MGLGGGMMPGSHGEAVLVGLVSEIVLTSRANVCPVVVGITVGVLISSWLDGGEALSINRHEV